MLPFENTLIITQFFVFVKGLTENFLFNFVISCFGGSFGEHDYYTISRRVCQGVLRKNLIQVLYWGDKELEYKEIGYKVYGFLIGCGLVWW